MTVCVFCFWFPCSNFARTRMICSQIRFPIRPPTKAIRLTLFPQHRPDPEDTVDDLAAPIDSEEIKEDQWMGVTVRSQSNGGKVSLATPHATTRNPRHISAGLIGNARFARFACFVVLFLQVLVCAHRYILKEGHKETESQHGQGLCYLLSTELEYEDTINPCLGRSTVRYVPLFREPYTYMHVAAAHTQTHTHIQSPNQECINQRMDNRRACARQQCERVCV